jgi:phenylalanine-4-hydroxylase
MCIRDRNQVLPGHTTHYHKDGYGTPVGYWTNTRQKPEELSLSELAELGMERGKTYSLQFQSGVKVEGIIRDFTFRDQKLLMITWEDCQVSDRDQVLFQPEWGTFDMGVGSALSAGYTGPADAEAFGLSYEAPAEKTHKIQHTDQAKQLHTLYANIRKMRMEGLVNGGAKEIWAALRKDFPGEWLAPLELLEVIRKDKAQTSLQEDIRGYLRKLRDSREDVSVLIHDGLLLLEQDGPAATRAPD